MLLTPFLWLFFTVEPKFQAAWDDIEPLSRSIEVVYYTKEQKEILTRAYFPLDPNVGWA